MACSAVEVNPELDFEKEEEAIFQVAADLAMDMEVEDSHLNTLPGTKFSKFLQPGICPLEPGLKPYP
jgi:hypothetical protein